MIMNGELQIQFMQQTVERVFSFVQAGIPVLNVKDQLRLMRFQKRDGILHLVIDDKNAVQLQNARVIGLEKHNLLHAILPFFVVLQKTTLNACFTKCVAD